MSFKKHATQKSEKYFNWWFAELVRVKPARYISNRYLGHHVSFVVHLVVT